MKAIPCILICLALPLASCGKKTAHQEESVGLVDSLTSEQTQLLTEVTNAADHAFRVKTTAKKDPTNAVLAVDYSRAASQLDAAKAKAVSAGVVELIIMDAETEGETKAEAFLNKIAADSKAEARE